MPTPEQAHIPPPLADCEIPASAPGGCEGWERAKGRCINDPRFHLPGKKVLTRPENKFELVWIDVTETPIERPKKNSGVITQVKRKDTP